MRVASHSTRCPTRSRALTPTLCSVLQARVGSSSPLTRRLYGLLAARSPGAHGVSEEALTCALAACQTEDGVLDLLAELLADHAADVIAEAIAGECESCARSEVQAAAASIALAVQSSKPGAKSMPALTRAVRHALAVPPAKPLSLVTLDASGCAPHSLLCSPACAWYLAPHITQAATTWTLLYSSDAHGKAFRTLSGRSCGRGAVMTLVRAVDGGAIAGGITDQPLAKRAAFFGGYQTRLFSLHPKAEVYKPTGSNTNCCWFAEGFESVPNGIGFGGQVGHFGLFMSESLDTGHSRMSATFSNPPLMGTVDLGGAFTVDAVELWSVDPLALQTFNDEQAKAARKAAAAAAGGGSVLDTRAQDRNFMQLALGGDRVNASDGVR